jgi:hypothetical protein
MGWKGRHCRNYVELNPSGWEGEYEVKHEIKSTDYGTFGIVEIGYDDEFMVFWRPNRNHTTSYYCKTMEAQFECLYSHTGFSNEPVIYPTIEEATASIPHWQKNFIHPPKRARHRPRDSQKGKVYRWEHIMAFELGGQERLEGYRRDTSILERKHAHIPLRMYLNSVLQLLGEKSVELKFRSGGRHSFGGYQIQLLPSHCNHLILLHELAHVLHRRWGTKTNKQRHQSHGKEFVGIYAYLLIRFCGIDKTKIIRHARTYKVNLLLPEQYWEWKEAERKAA